MSTLIRNGQVVSDEWKIVALAEGETPQRVRLPAGPLLVPLAVWRARRYELIQREYEHGWPLGVWLTAEENAETIAHDIDDFTVVALELNERAADRSLANARQLRELGYRGELRAIGAVSPGGLSGLRQAGFNSFAVTEDANSADASIWSGLTELLDFSTAILPGSRLAGATA